MKKLKLYLDTTVISFIFADDAPEKRDATREFLAATVASGNAEVFVSEIVLRELSRTNDQTLREKLLEQALDPGLVQLDTTVRSEEILELASVYMEEQIVPDK